MVEDDLPLSPMMERVLREWEYRDATSIEINELLDRRETEKLNGKLGEEYTATIITPHQNHFH